LIGSSAIPHFGHGLCVLSFTSGCIGQVYPCFDGAVAGTIVCKEPSYLAESSANFFRQDWLQKCHVLPLCTVDHFAASMDTVMPQTGSTERALIIAFWRNEA
jgi:hypothetical protein